MSWDRSDGIAAAVAYPGFTAPHAEPGQEGSASASGSEPSSPPESPRYSAPAAPFHTAITPAAPDTSPFASITKLEEYSNNKKLVPGTGYCYYWRLSSYGNDEDSVSYATIYHHNPEDPEFPFTQIISFTGTLTAEKVREFRGARSPHYRPPVHDQPPTDFQHATLAAASPASSTSAHLDTIESFEFYVASPATGPAAVGSGDMKRSHPPKQFKPNTAYVTSEDLDGKSFFTVSIYNSSDQSVKIRYTIPADSGIINGYWDGARTQILNNDSWDFFHLKFALNNHLQGYPFAHITSCTPITNKTRGIAGMKVGVAYYILNKEDASGTATVYCKDPSTFQVKSYWNVNAPGGRLTLENLWAYRPSRVRSVASDDASATSDDRIDYIAADFEAFDSRFTPEEKRTNRCCKFLAGAVTAGGGAWLGLEIAAYLKCGLTATVVLGALGTLTAIGLFLLLVKCMRTPSLDQSGLFKRNSASSGPQSPATQQGLVYTADDSQLTPRFESGNTRR